MSKDALCGTLKLSSPFYTAESHRIKLHPCGVSKMALGMFEA